MHHLPAFIYSLMPSPTQVRTQHPGPFTWESCTLQRPQDGLRDFRQPWKEGKEPAGENQRGRQALEGVAASVASPCGIQCLLDLEGLDRRGGRGNLTGLTVRLAPRYPRALGS